MKDYFELDGIFYDLNELLIARLRASFPHRVLLYLQSFASEDYSFDQSYALGLFRSPQPTNLDTHSTDQADLDYKESANITATSETEVLQDIEFILSEPRLHDSIIEGLCDIGLQLRIRADGTYTTYLSKVRVSLYSRDQSGNDTAILSNKTYTLDTPVSHSADSWDDMVAIKFHENIARTVVPDDNRLVLRVEVFGYVSDASATNNKVRLYFSRGSAESYILLPIIEGLSP